MLYITYLTFLMTCLFQTFLAVSNYDTGNGRIYRLKVTQDVCIERPTQNHNSLPYLILARHSDYPLKRSLIQFEQLPAACPLRKIRWAKMYLYFSYAHKASGHSVQKAPYLSHTINVHLVKKSWQEASATSGQRYNGAPWDQTYLKLGTDAEAAPQHPETTLLSYRPSGFMEFDVTNAITSWRRGQPNYGLLLKVVNEKSNGRDLRFFSKNSGDSKKHAFIDVMCK